MEMFENVLTRFDDKIVQTVTLRISTKTILEEIHKFKIQ